MVGRCPSFCTLDYSVVHNGEISSYDANRRTIEMYGYKCTLLTDTEVITYIIDYLNRKVGLTLEEIAGVVAAPFCRLLTTCPKNKRKNTLILETFFHQC